MSDVFVSYKREDRADIEPLVQLLEDEGLEVWWDPDLIAGDRFDEIIAEEIEKAACVVVAWSRRSINAMWIRDEATAGRERGVLVPLSLDGVQPPLGFRQLQTPDLSHWSGDRCDPRLQQLIAGVKRLIRSGREPGIEPEPEHESERTRKAITLSRRRMLQLGAVGLTSVTGLWLGISSLHRKSPPPTHQEAFNVVTVDATGRVNPPQSQSVDVFEVVVGNAAMQFSVIQAGGFQIGSPESEPERQRNEGPARFIELRRFALSRTTVTQAQWTALLDAAQEPVALGLPRNPSFFQGDDLPVETVSWYQASEYCQRLSGLTGLHMRLPSEAEWEYACRAQTTSPFHFGPTITAEVANYCGTGGAVRGTTGGKDISSLTYGDATYESGAYANGPMGTFIGATVPARWYPPNPLRALSDARQRLGALR